MRVHILQRPSGVLEGVTLSAFIPGVSYDVDPLLGSHLVVAYSTKKCIPANIKF